MGVTLEFLLRRNRCLIVMGMATQHILGLVILELGCFLWCCELAHCHVDWKLRYLAGRAHEWGRYFFGVNLR